MQFGSSRVAIKVEAYDRNSRNTKAPNALQRRAGIEILPLVLGRIQYTSLRKDRDTAQIKVELA